MNAITPTMMLRPAAERGMVDIGWLKSAHSFSFGDYYDENHMGFGPLRVINDDLIAPGGGFPMHPHRNMEIITYVLSGAVEHRDSLGNGSVIRPGNVQRMSAGRGIRHSEFNPSDSEGLHLLQIWMLPSATGLEPGYEEKQFSDADKRGRLRLIASPDGADGSVTIRTGVKVYAGILGSGDSLRHELPTGRIGWVQVARGSLSVNGQALKAGDGLALGSAGMLTFSGAEDAEILLFDMQPLDA